MMKLMKRHVFPLIFLLALTVSFFAKLFLPQPKLYYTPDFGRSDIWNQNYPFKELLSQSLKNHTLPFWTSKIGTGFPVFAEGQSGSLYFQNLILFYLFPTWLAWNLSFPLIFLTCALGTYFFFSRLKISPQGSLLGAVAFSFSGYFVMRIVHINYIQAAALIPWLFYFADRFFEKPDLKNGFYYALILSQQVFAGGLQWVFMGLWGVFLFNLVGSKDKDWLKKPLFFWLVAVWGFFLAAPQLIPTWELKAVSLQKYALPESEIFRFSFTYEDLLGFAAPHFSGEVKTGTYPSPFSGEGRIYWENSCYMGVITLVLAGLGLAGKNKNRKQIALIILLCFSLLLGLGDSTPLEFIFKLPGFNLFRVPVRYLLLALFSIAAFAGLGLDRILAEIRKRGGRCVFLVFPFCLTLLLVELFYYGFDYHPLVKAEEALAVPEMTTLIAADKRVYTDRQQFIEWNKVFFTAGWQEIEPYLFFKNGLMGNLNVLYGVSNLDAYAAFAPFRLQVANQLADYLVDASGVEYLITNSVLAESEDLVLTASIDSGSDSLPAYHLYKKRKTVGRFHLVSDYQVLQTVADSVSAVYNGFDFQQVVILEKEIGLEFEPLRLMQVELLEEGQRRMKLKTSTDQQAILVLADSYYPGWRAEIDGAVTEILPANINQRAVVVPAGEHEVLFVYDHRKFRLGVLIGLAGFLVWPVLWLVEKNKGGCYKRVNDPA